MARIAGRQSLFETSELLQIALLQLEEPHLLRRAIEGMLDTYRSVVSMHFAVAAFAPN